MTPIRETYTELEISLARRPVTWVRAPEPTAMKDVQGKKTKVALQLKTRSFKLTQEATAFAPRPSAEAYKEK